VISVFSKFCHARQVEGGGAGYGESALAGKQRRGIDKKRPRCVGKVSCPNASPSHRPTHVARWLPPFCQRRPLYSRTCRREARRCRRTPARPAQNGAATVPR